MSENGEVPKPQQKSILNQKTGRRRLGITALRFAGGGVVGGFLGTGLNKIIHKGNDNVQADNIPPATVQFESPQQQLQ